MRQSTLIFVILALGVASAAAPDWAANWEVPSNQTGRCQLRDRILIAQREKNLYIEFSMSGTECNGFYTGTFKAFPEIPAEGNSIAFMAYFHGDMNSYYKFKATISIEGDNLIFTPEEAVEGGKVTLKRSTLKPTVNWVGTWKVKARNTGDNICAPKSEVVIAEQGSSLLVSWIWDSSEVCKAVGLDGKKFISSVPIPVNNPVMLYIRVHDIETLGFFSVAQDTGIWAHSNFPGHLTFEKSSNGSFLTVALVVLAVAVSVAGVLLISK